VDPQLIIFAITSAIKLGKKINETLIDETRGRYLSLPIGDFGGRTSAQAEFFFNQERYIKLISPGGPYVGLEGDELRDAYTTVLQLEEELGQGSNESVEILVNYHQIEQWKKGHGPKHPAQRIIGTIIEIGIDYYTANPPAISKNSNANKIVAAFIQGLDDVKIAEGDDVLKNVAQSTLGTALQVLGDQSNLLTNDKRVQVLIGGVTTALYQDLKESGVDVLIDKENLFERFSGSILRGGATAVSENINLFLPIESTEVNGKLVIKAAVLEILGGIQKNEDLFTPDMLEEVALSALKVVAENPEIVVRDKFVEKLISNTLTALTEGEGKKLFSNDSVALILRESLETVGQNAHLLINPDNPYREFASETVSALSTGLAAGLKGSNVSVKDLISTTMLVEMTSILLTQVAKNPDKLLGGKNVSVEKKILTQIIGSVSAVVAQDPKRLGNGETYLELMEVSLAIAVKNVDKLLKLDTTDPKDNLLYQVLQQISEVVLTDDDRNLVDPEVWVEIVQQVLPIASSNVGAISGNPLVQTAVKQALRLASAARSDNINGENLSGVVAEILKSLIGDSSITAADIEKHVKKFLAQII
jgi:hypothetical protein